MQIVMQVLGGGLLVAIGVLLVVKNYQVANSIHLTWLENKMGSGSGYLLWKIIAVLVIFAGFTVMFGLHDNVIAWITSPLSNALGGVK